MQQADMTIWSVMNLQFLVILPLCLWCSIHGLLHTSLLNSWKSFSSHCTSPRSRQGDSRFLDPKKKSNSLLYGIVSYGPEIPCDLSALVFSYHFQLSTLMCFR